MKTISDEELERRFDACEDVMDFVDADSATRPNLEKADNVVAEGVPVEIFQDIDWGA